MAADFKQTVATGAGPDAAGSGDALGLEIVLLTLPANQEVKLGFSVARVARGDVGHDLLEEVGALADG